MQCPSCKTGILETIAYIDLAEAKSIDLRVRLAHYPPIRSLIMTLVVCSNDPCSHTQLISTPGFAREAKRLIRESVLTEQIQKQQLETSIKE